MSTPTYLATLIAARVLRISVTELAELARGGKVKRYGGYHGHYSVADLAAVRGDPITPADIDFAEAMHARRKAAYAKQNRKRQAHAAHL